MEKDKTFEEAINEIRDDTILQIRTILLLMMGKIRILESEVKDLKAELKDVNKMARIAL
jgi:hypothetical protein